MKIPAWVADYSGIPFVEHGRDRTGCDCWGLHRLIHAERYQVELPDFTGYSGTSSKADGEIIARLITGWIDAGDWLEIDWRVGSDQRGANGVRWNQLRESDSVLLRIDARPWHIGLLVAPRLMLHTQYRMGVHIEELDGLRWKDRILDFRRHRLLADRPN